MAVGDQAKAVVHSYIAHFLESTYGTYPATAATGATSIEALSCSFKKERKSEKVDGIFKTRGPSRRVQLDVEVGGTLEQYLHPQESTRLFAVALGGGIASTITANSTTIHSITAGNFDTNNSSISFNMRKGDTHVFGYVGGRVNVLKLSAQAGEPAKVSYDMIFKDATISISDIGTSLSISSVVPFTFVDGVYRYQASESIVDTTTAEEPIQGFELTINNNLKSDKDARQLGSSVLTVLPATRREIEFKIMQRFDTTTNYNRFIQATTGSVELRFVGATITNATAYKAIVRLPKVYLNSPDPELGGSGDILGSEITFDVVTDTPNTTTGKDIGVTFENDITSYAS